MEKTLHINFGSRTAKYLTNLYHKTRSKEYQQAHAMTIMNEIAKAYLPGN